MLNPNSDRLDYGQILAPPAEYDLDLAVGTTYSLDLDALVGASLALGLSEETDSELMNNPVCLLEALRSTGDKVALFCEGGQIHLPNRVTALYILLEKMVLDTLEFYCGGALAVVCVTLDMMKSSGAKDCDIDGIASIPRQIEGVKLGVTMREKPGGEYRFSVRSCDEIDASSICKSFGGGGHRAAAGCSINKDKETAKAEMLDVCIRTVEGAV